MSPWNFVALSLGAVSVCQAEPVSKSQVEQAQFEMLGRIKSDVEYFAKGIGIEPFYISYCRTKMSLETAGFPKDGSIPLGVDYFSIKDSGRLELVIGHREAFETGYLRLCLANAKSALSGVAKK